MVGHIGVEYSGRGVGVECSGRGVVVEYSGYIVLWWNIVRDVVKW